MKNKKQVHITLVSPVDVMKERNIVEEVCEEFNELLGNKLEIVVHRWENYPQVFHQDPQAGFDSYHELAKSDLIIAVMWYRLGTFLPEKYRGKVTGAERVTGTQFELEEAIQYQKNIWVYRKIDNVNLTIDELAEVGEQKQKLEQFIDAIGLKSAEARHGQHFFKHKEFKVKFQKHLQAWLKKEYDVKIVLARKTKSSLKQPELHPNYLVGLYMVLVLGSIMAFMWTNMMHQDRFSETLRQIVWGSVSILLLMVVIGIRALPVELNGFYIESFRVSLKKVFIRGAFILLIALLFGFFFGFFIIPSLKDSLLNFMYLWKSV
jgi:hypothetical protein